MGQCLKIGGAGVQNQLPQFTYTGTYAVKGNPDAWEIEFKTSGVFTLLKPKELTIDVFAVGGGGGGSCNGSGYSNGGAGGGYTKTVRKILVSQNVRINVVVGNGGSAQYNVDINPTNGGISSMLTCSANGGIAGDGGAGGSGGGGKSLIYPSQGNNGGADGSNGQGAGGKNGIGGVGQATTTKKFGEQTGVLYAGGGGAGGNAGDLGQSGSWAGGVGGAGGGGAGGLGSRQGLASTGGQAGSVNTGGGGGGAGMFASSGGSGGSGIVIIRNAR